VLLILVVVIAVFVIAVFVIAVVFCYPLHWLGKRAASKTPAKMVKDEKLDMLKLQVEKSISCLTPYEALPIVAALKANFVIVMNAYATSNQDTLKTIMEGLDTNSLKMMHDTISGANNIDHRVKVLGKQIFATTVAEINMQKTTFALLEEAMTAMADFLLGAAYYQDSGTDWKAYGNEIMKCIIQKTANEARAAAAAAHAM
jgi:hypothetical protein